MVYLFASICARIHGENDVRNVKSYGLIITGLCTNIFVDVSVVLKL